MKRMAGKFNIVTKDGVVADTFEWYADSNNHHNISNKSGCIYDGYEGLAEWERIKKEHKHFSKVFGMKFELIK